MSNQRYYEAVAEELQRRFIRPGLWARAVAETGGEGDAARALYIRFRVSELEEEERSERARAAAEMERRASEAARAEQRERADAERPPMPYVGWIFIGAIGFILAALILAVLLGSL